MWMQWMCRFIHTILKSPSEYHLDTLLYASDLLQNALDVEWATAKGSYKVLMTETMTMHIQTFFMLV